MLLILREFLLEYCFRSFSSDLRAEQQPNLKLKGLSCVQIFESTITLLLPVYYRTAGPDHEQPKDEVDSNKCFNRWPLFLY